MLSGVVFQQRFGTTSKPPLNPMNMAMMGGISAMFGGISGESVDG